MSVCGIDEAGRGPVIGPLVICGVIIDKEDELLLQTLGVKDSKLLTPLQRERIFPELLKLKHKLIVVPPMEIDAAVISKESNLNWLEAQKSADIINALKPTQAIVDCPSTNIPAYQAYLQNLLKQEVLLTVEHKADVNHIVVGAASILAKVTRDRIIEELSQRVGESVGSGYPADPLTQSFLKRNYQRHPEIFRHSWESYRAVAEGKKQKSLGDF